MSGHLVKNGPEYPHRCDPPYGRKQRKQFGEVRIGAIWQCDVCEDMWRWGRGYDMFQWTRLRHLTAEGE